MLTFALLSTSTGLSQFCDFPNHRFELDFAKKLSQNPVKTKIINSPHKFMFKLYVQFL